IEPKTRGVTLSSFSGVHLADKHSPVLIDSLGLFGESFLTRSIFMDDAPQKHVLFGNTPAFDRQVDRLLSVPIALQGVISGTLTVVNKKHREPFTEEEVTALQTLAIQAGAAIDNARFIQEKEKQAVTDGLTGIYNRVEFHKRISIEYERSLRNRSDFSILLIDIDFFKRINDSYGHPAGDVVLKDVVKIIQNCIRNFDFMARYGGEEFIVILPETDGIRAALVADRIRSSVEDHSFIIPSRETEHLTISAGIASFPLDSATAEDIITAADDALYFCKNSGRNRIARFSEIAKIK
ncbi:MAG TPA: sensor domain-containing diguanylate cyclase, partial [Nitrospiria bacterium]|nr:sensor domain-containing diguanylate cyclase [Nitrospiria bacterium]